MTSQTREIKFNETTVTGRCTPKTTKKAHIMLHPLRNFFSITLRTLEFFLKMPVFQKLIAAVAGT